MNFSYCKLLRKLFLLVFCFVFVYSCSNSNGDYFPLKVGLQWEYEEENINLDFNKKSPVTRKYVEIIGEKNINGLNFFEFSTSELSGKTYKYYTSSNLGILIKESINEDAVSYLPFVKDSVISWNSSLNISKEDLKISGKAYKDCIKLVSVYGKDSLTRYYAQGIGLVKEILSIKSDNKNLIRTITLISFKD